jgi:hypothetical protein
MDLNRLRIDAFAFALGALALLTAGFFSTRNSGAVVMCGLCLAGLLVARLAGFSNRALWPLAGGLVVLLWMAWLNPVSDPRTTSAIAHAIGGALVGWALAEFLRGRMSWPGWGLAAIAAVVGVTVAWELGEYMADRLLGSSLAPNKTDSALDIFFGTFGGFATVAFAWLLASRAPE